MDQLWANSGFPEFRPHVVLRLKLRPLSPGHELLLSAIGSPFTAGGNVSAGDLMTAGMICAGRFQDGARLLRSPRRLKFFTALWRLVNPRSINWPAELAAFNDYLSEGRWSPPTAERHGPGWSSRELKAPRAWRLIHFLCSQMNLSEAAALDFPCARAAAYFATQCDLEGSIDLEGGAKDAALLAHLEDLERRAAAGEPVWD